METGRFLRWTMGIVAAAVAVGVLAVAGWAGDPDFDPPSATLAPDPVTGGEDVLYSVRFPYTGLDSRQTLTHVRVVVELPSGWTADGAAPDTCAEDGATLTCEHGSIRPGAVVVQDVRAQTSAVAAAEAATVRARPTFDERDADGAPGSGRVDTIFAPDASVQVTPPTATRSAECVAPEGGEVSTTATRGIPMSIAAEIPPTDALCSPTSLEARPADDPVVIACPVGIECTTPIGVTASPLFTTGAPTRLIFRVQGKRFTARSPWYKDGQLPAVPACSGPEGVASPDPCIESQTKSGKAVTVVVLSSGADPGWQG